MSLDVAARISCFVELAAVYGVAITKAHAFLDDNKRTALLATGLFLVLNGFLFDYHVYDDRASCRIGTLYRCRNARRRAAGDRGERQPLRTDILRAVYVSNSPQASGRLAHMELLVCDFPIDLNEKCGYETIVRQLDGHYNVLELCIPYTFDGVVSSAIRKKLY